MGVRIIFAHIMPVLGDGRVRRQFFQPFLIVMVQAGFIIVDKDGSRDVHGVHEYKALSDAALFQASFHLGSHIDQGSSGAHMKPQFFAVISHPGLLSEKKKVNAFI